MRDYNSAKQDYTAKGATPALISPWAKVGTSFPAILDVGLAHGRTYFFKMLRADLWRMTL